VSEQVTRLEAVEKQVIVRLLKQDHDYLYGNQEGGAPKFEAPKKEGIKMLQLERGIKERAMRDRFRRRRKQHLNIRRAWEQQMVQIDCGWAVFWL